MKKRIIKLVVTICVVSLGIILGTLLYQMARAGFNADPVVYTNLVN